MTGPVSTALKPLKIGDIEVANPVLLAPMSGITDAPFRRLAAALGYRTWRRIHTAAPLVTSAA